MNNRILIIVIDDNLQLSDELSRRFIYHEYVSDTESIHAHPLSNYLDIAIVSTNQMLLQSIIDQSTRLIYIGTDICSTRISAFASIDDFCLDVICANKSFLTNYEHNHLMSIKKIAICIIVVNDPDSDINMVIHSVTQFAESFDPFRTGYLVNTIHLTIINPINTDNGPVITDVITTYASIQIHIMTLNDQDEYNLLTLQSFNHLPINDLMYFYGMYKFQSEHNVLNKKIDLMIALKSSQCVVLAHRIIHQMLNKILTSHVETIYLSHAGHAIGSKRIMLYLMLIFQYYGTYHSDQLFDHLIEFSNVVLSDIYLLD